MRNSGETGANRAQGELGRGSLIKGPIEGSEGRARKRGCGLVYVWDTWRAQDLNREDTKLNHSKMAEVHNYHAHG